MSENGAGIVMIGTAPQTQGGVSAVVNVLDDCGLLRRCGVDYIATHCDGNAGAKLAILLRAWSRFAWRMLRGRVTLLHAHTASRASFWRKSLFIVPAILARVPVVLHLHGAEFQIFHGEEISPRARRFVRWVFEHVCRVVVLSKSWQSWVHSVFPAAKVEVIFNPVVIPPLTGNGSKVRQHATVLFLGRLGQRKGAYDLLQTASRLVPRHPELRLLLAGDGELEKVRAEARALGIETHVELLGWVRGAEKIRLLDEASVYVLPSYNEGLPMGVLEAMAHGVPVVSTQVGGIPEAVSDGVEGFLITPGDVDALTERLDRLLCDEALRARMGAAARRRAQKDFGVEGIVQRWVALYAELGVATTLG